MSEIEQPETGQQSIYNQHEISSHQSQCKDLDTKRSKRESRIIALKEGSKKAPVKS